VVSFGVLPLLLSLSLLSQTIQTIERAFFQADPGILHSLFSAKNHINISFPDPISFSDQLSPEQAYFLVRRIYNKYSTFEFYPDPELPVLAKEKSAIFKARWSFKNKKNDNRYVLQVFFHLMRGNDTAAGGSPNPWRITEIKAERL
jgi:hypothetical protein